MSSALVGSAGAVNSTGANTANTPAFGASESRTVGNLLILWVAGFGSTTLPAAPSGWTAAQRVGNASSSASIFWKVATGGDSAPTVAAVSGTSWMTRLAEFSGNDQNNPPDQGATHTTAGTSLAVGNPGQLDTLPGELVITCVVARFGAAVTGTPISLGSPNNGITLTEVNNNATSTTNHYSFAYGTGTSNATGDQVTATISAANETGAESALQSFALYSIPQGAVARQAVQRAAVS